LVEHFTLPHWQLDTDVMPVLEQYGWPGNVRQLQNAIERAKILSDDGRIHVTNLPPEVIDGSDSLSQFGTGEIDLLTHTRSYILDVYRRHRNNKAETARSLGISRRTLYRLLEKYGVRPACSR
jgi:transcriptional regulator of acetoin/glycerol metabolism